MTPRKSDPLAAVTAINERIEEREAKAKDFATRASNAQRLLDSFEERRTDALRLRELGEEVSVPDDDERARLVKAAKEAGEEYVAAEEARRHLEEQRKVVYAENVPALEHAAEGKARAYEAKVEQGKVVTREIGEAGREKDEAWGPVRVAWRVLGRECEVQVPTRDFAALDKELDDAYSRAWATGSEAGWRRVVEREAV